MYIICELLYNTVSECLLNLWLREQRRCQLARRDQSAEAPQIRSYGTSTRAPLCSFRERRSLRGRAARGAARERAGVRRRIRLCTAHCPTRTDTVRYQ